MMFTYPERLQSKFDNGDVKVDQSNGLDIDPTNVETQNTEDESNGVMGLSTDDGTQILSCLSANKLHDNLSSTAHTETNMTQHSSSQHSHSFEGNIFFDDSNRFGGVEDDVSITEEFFEDSNSNFKIDATEGIISPTYIDSRDRSTLIGSFSSVDQNAGQPVGSSFTVQKNGIVTPPADMEGSMASLNDAFENLNRCMERSSHTRAIIRQLSQSNPILRGLSDEETTDQYFNGNLSSPSLSLETGQEFSRKASKKHGSFGKTLRKNDSFPSRRNDSSGSLPKTASLSEMKRSGIAPLKKMKNGSFSSASKAKTKLSNGMRNRILRDLYVSSSTKAKHMK